MNKINAGNIAAVVLAGGKSLRMNGRNKITLPFANNTLLGHTIAKLQSQVGYVVLNCNEPSAVPSDIKLPIVPDQHNGTAGPLDGLVSTMAWLKSLASGHRWLLSAPVDCPFLPPDFLLKLKKGIEEKHANIAFATSANNKHYACSLWSLELAEEGRKYLNSGQRAIKHFISQQDYLEIEFPLKDTDPFFNINTPKDYENALKIHESKKPFSGH